nr:transposase [Anaerocolumna cellulosilytica]
MYAILWETIWIGFYFPPLHSFRKVQNGELNRFDSPEKILAHAGLSPSTYHSGHFESSYSHKEKRTSKYLRYALFNVAKFVSHLDPTFSAYLNKKRSEDKRYITASKKLVRVIYQLEKLNQSYIKAAIFVMQFLIFNLVLKAFPKSFENTNCSLDL